MSAHSSLAAGLAEAFDRSFVAAPPPPRDLRGFATIHVGAESYAVALDEIAAIVPVTRIVPLPGAAASLLGAMGHKGEIIFVHDMARLLGFTQAPPRWALLAAAATAFAFERLGPCLRLTTADITPINDRGPFRATVTADRRPVLSVAALLDRISSEQRSLS